MMFIYSQSSGRMWQGTEDLGVAYAGHPPHRNDPASQEIVDFGPIPRGVYGISKSIMDAKLGPVTMALTPLASNQMFGRSGFYIHGDNAEHPGLSSDGCIVADLTTRHAIDASLDKLLMVIY